MPAPGRFTSGVATRPSTHPMGSFPAPDPSRVFCFFDDFEGYRTSLLTVPGWRSVAASGTIAANVTGNGGLVAQSTQASAGAFATTQWNISASASALTCFRPTFGKQAWLASRFKVTDADQDNVFIGGSVATVDPFGTDPTDKFVIRSLNATPDALLFATGPSLVATVGFSLGTTLDDTFTSVYIYYDGKRTISGARYLDSGVIVARGSVDIGASGAALPDADLAPNFSNQTKDASADTMTLDYILMAVER
jgi:hypothetical protein